MKIRTKVALTTAACLATLTVVFYFAGRLLVVSNVDSIQAQFNEMPDFHNTMNAELKRLADLSIAAAKDSRTIEYVEKALPHEDSSAIPGTTVRDGQVVSDKQLDLFAIATADGKIRAAAVKVNGEISEAPESILSYIGPENDCFIKTLTMKKAANIAGLMALQMRKGSIFRQYLVSVVPILSSSSANTNSPAGILVFGRDIENLGKIGKSISYFGKRDMRDYGKNLTDSQVPYKPFVNEVKISNDSENGTGNSVISIPLRDFFGYSYAQIDFEYNDATKVIQKDAEARLQIVLAVIALFFFIPIFLVNTYVTNKAIRKLVKQTTGKEFSFFKSWNAEDEIKSIEDKISSTESELKELRDKYDLSEQTIAAIQNATPGTVLLYRDDGEIVYCHLSVGKPHASGLAKAIEKGKNVKDVRGLKDDVFKREIQAVDAAAKHGGCHIIQFSASDGIGAIIWLEARITRVKPELLLAHLDDITARKSAGLERSKIDEKIKDIAKTETFGILAGGLAHDYNNMLTAMLGNIDLILGGELSDQTRDALTDVRTAMIRAASLVRRMLSYAGKSGPTMEDTNLCNLVSDITRLMRRSIPDNAKIILDTPDTTPVIRVDSTQIWQVLMNLIVNGCDAMEGMPGTVRISTSGQELSDRELSIYNSREPLTPGWYACVEVEDTGKGMDDPTIARIFEPFFTTKPNGKGLGLPSVINIIYSYNGGITIRSTVGRGSIFKIVIPARLRSNGDVLLPDMLKKRQEEKAKTDIPSMTKHDTQPVGSAKSLDDTEKIEETQSADEQKAAEPIKKSGKASILIVDDDPSILKLLKLILKSGGYDVTDCASGKDGLKTFENAATPFNLCLMDVSMGAGISGLELCAEIRKRNPEIPVILMSAYRAKEMSSKMSEAGVSGFLAKPFRGTDVLDLVKKFLQNQPGQNNEGGTGSGAIS